MYTIYSALNLKLSSLIPKCWIDDNRSRLVEISVDQPLPVTSIQFCHFNPVGSCIRPINVPGKCDKDTLSSCAKFKTVISNLSCMLGEVPSNPVHSDAVRVRNVSQVQIHLFHWVVATIIECSHIGPFDGAKLRPPTQNCPVHNT